MRDSIVISANRSGVSWTADFPSWEAQCSEAGCRVCGHLAGRNRANTVAATDAIVVEADPRATLPGYVCVVSRRHVVEPYDLTDEEQSQFFLDSMTVARGLAAVIQPVKMNYEIHGNTGPHLHLHLYPRKPGDVYVGYPITNREWFHRSPAEIDRLGEAIRVELAARGRLIAVP